LRQWPLVDHGFKSVQSINDPAGFAIEVGARLAQCSPEGFQPLHETFAGRAQRQHAPACVGGVVFRFDQFARNEGCARLADRGMRDAKHCGQFANRHRS
jgi:hypothetical protein